MRKFLLLIFIAVLPFIAACEADTLPSRYDLRDYGRITGVKDQGKLSVCGVFAAYGAMESNYLTQGLKSAGKIPDFSEMHAIYYGYGYSGVKPEQNFTPKFWFERFSTTALCAKLSFPALEKDMKYTDKIKQVPKSAAKKSPEDYKIPVRLRDAYFLSFIGTDNINAETQKKLIIEHGAIMAGYYSDDRKYHRAGKYYTYFYDKYKNRTTHEVLLAGWDDDFSRDNFNPKPSKNGAWLVKNSWGTEWGNKGYFWMSYEQPLYGGTAFILEEFNPDMRHYGYDDLGFCQTVACSWGANVFRIREDNEVLKETAFYTAKNNTDYEIFVYDSGFESGDNPVSGLLIAKCKGNIELAGYHTVKLPEEIAMKKGQYFSVVLKTSRKIMPVETKRNRHSENAVVHEHESYFSNDGIKWTDGINISGGSNACIKAFTIKKF